MSGFLAFFLTWWGVLVIAALDASLVFFMPFGIDALVIYLAARDERLFWIYPLLGTAGSLAGAAVTFWIGRKAGEVGLERLVPPSRLEPVRARVRKSGAIAMALPALLPPPFPLTPFILTCGALSVSRALFFSTFGAMRLLRFSIGAALARIYGQSILAIAQTDQFRMVVIGAFAVALVATIASAVMLWRNSLRPSVAGGI